MVAQIPLGPPPRQRSVVERQDLHNCRDVIPPLITRGEWCIPAVMWRDIVEVRQTLLTALRIIGGSHDALALKLMRIFDPVQVKIKGASLQVLKTPVLSQGIRQPDYSQNYRRRGECG